MREAFTVEGEQVNETELAIRYVIAQWIAAGIDRDTHEDVMEVINGR